MNETIQAPIKSETYNWILLRGLSREVRHWGAFPNILKSKNERYRVFPLELPGNGKKFGIDSKSSLIENVEDLRKEFLELRKQNSGNFGVIAISLGGMVALTWADKYPDDFKDLVVLNSSAGDLSSVFKRLQPGAMKEIFKLICSSTYNDNIYDREKTILKMTTTMTPLTDELIKKWADFGQEYPMTRKNVFRQLYSALKFVVPKRLKCNTLILSGAKDSLCHPQCSEIIAKLYNSKSAVHPEAGHDLTLDDPNWLASQIAENIHL
ncbi:MAG: alpha/beta hydrolase [Bacteriovoracaceae bacterium]|jgi:pimeloyl-[acyl-carrier protein] methyl ester esterase|nr:alpha/beta hydrolase [Bacteriovoracaceae bacterium]